jgi:hypothetical protein
MVCDKIYWNVYIAEKQRLMGIDYDIYWDKITLKR